MSSLMTTLQSILAHCGDTYLVIDALDEFGRDDERAELLAMLSEFKAWKLPHLHVLVTSRDEVDIRQKLSSLVTIPAVPIQYNKVQEDVRLHVRSQLEKHPDLVKWSIRIQDEIEEALVNGAHGM
jgi:hypothetical protein